jgi:GT2 family glycosyltransferase
MESGDARAGADPPRAASALTDRGLVATMLPVSAQAYGSISIVIPTFNRREGILRTLAALGASAPFPRPVEVVVVDDGSSDGTIDSLAGRAFPFSLQTLRQKNSGPAVARNAGVKAATGELILFLDDDVEPQPGLLAEHLATHGERRDLVVVGPLGSLPHYPQPWVAWEQRQVEKQYRALEAREWEPTFRQFWTGNASLGRDHLLAVGGFDASYLRAEDVELGVRLHERGLSFRFNPRARVLHHARRSLDSWCEMHRRYGSLEPKIYSGKHGGILQENWQYMHPAMRVVVRAFAGRDHLKPVVAVLRGVLRGCERAGVSRPAMAPCSVLANLLFWDGVAQTVGKTDFEVLMSAKPA